MNKYEEMNKHDKMRYGIECMSKINGLSNNHRYLLDYINSCEATEKELEIYKKLHQKYQYLNENTNDYDLNVDEVTTIHDEIYELEEKLSNVGNE